MSPLDFKIEPSGGPAPAAGMFIVCWPEANGDGRYLHNAHPDRRVIDSKAGDALVHRERRERYRMLAVQRFKDWTVCHRAGMPAVRCIAHGCYIAPDSSSPM